LLLEPLRIDKLGIHAAARIDAPPARVFAHVSDLRNMVAWWPEHPVYRRLLGDGGPRSLYAWVYMVRGVPVLGWSRVLERETNRRFAYRVGPPGVGARFEYELAAEGPAATRLELAMLTPFARLAGFEAQIAPEMTRALDRLAEHLAAPPDA
jgi:uncharacterized protein YndB with AHSA1/START domain